MQCRTRTAKLQGAALVPVAGGGAADVVALRDDELGVARRRERVARRERTAHRALALRSRTSPRASATSGIVIADLRLDQY